ncbi:MAG: hypothetical protein QJR13_07380, partial [Bacillota bacterium]|nr:hypothetical protein [Bacillota bacterium]
MEERARPVRDKAVWLTGAVALAAFLFSWLVQPSRLQAASIVGSFHDLSHIDEHHMADLYAGRVYNDYNEVCVYCHTPHHASTVQQPLWNRQNYTVSYQTYFSETMDTTPGQPGPVSRLCLSCHDGTIAVDAVLNVPNAPYVELSQRHARMLPYNDPNTVMENCSDCHIDNGWGWPDFRHSFLGTDLRND